MPDRARRIFSPCSRRLLIRPGAIGDFLLSLPALEFLKTEYTEVWCSEQNVPLAQFADCARSIGSVSLDRVGLLPAADVLAKLAAFDEIHSWYGANRPEFREQVATLPFHFHDAVPLTAGEHATDFYCGQVGAPLGLPRLAVTQSQRRGDAVFHPFASNRAKQWPLDHFRALAERMGDVTWCAGPDEPLDGAVRIGNLMELAQWLAGARIFVGNDSGITHLAAAVGTPVVAIFGPTDSGVWAPRGPNIRVLSRMPLTAITPREVFALARDLS